SGAGSVGHLSLTQGADAPRYGAFGIGPASFCGASVGGNKSRFFFPTKLQLRLLPCYLFPQQHTPLNPCVGHPISQHGGFIMPAVKAWKFGEKSAPFFPSEVEILKKAVLQVTDIKTNRNKDYALQLHGAKAKGKQLYRVFSHYGRPDDLELNPDAGQKECRHFNSLPEAEAGYQSIYREKTSSRKGYKEVSLASSKIGSQKARGTGS